MSDLLQAQQHFTLAIAQFVVKAYELGYKLTYGEAYRTAEQALWNVKTGTGILNSLHRLRLAIDFNGFQGDTFLTTADQYRPLGELWESMGGTWGGRFIKPDAYHFSIEWQGVK